jgi:hypothetical protein
MKAVRGKKLVGAAVTVVVALVAATVAFAATFPARYYPAPVVSKGGALSLCPSSAGLAPFSAATVKAATYAADAYPMVNETAGLALSDQAWWPQVRSESRNNKVGPTGWTPTRSEPLVKAGDLSSIIRRSCGQALVRLSELVGVAPNGRGNCDACRSNLFFLNRHGRTLLYYIY